MEGLPDSGNDHSYFKLIIVLGKGFDCNYVPEMVAKLKEFGENIMDDSYDIVVEMEGDNPMFCLHMDTLKFGLGSLFELLWDPGGWWKYSEPDLRNFEKEYFMYFKYLMKVYITFESKFKGYWKMEFKQAQQSLGIILLTTTQLLRCGDGKLKKDSSVVVRNEESSWVRRLLPEMKMESSFQSDFQIYIWDPGVVSKSKCLGFGWTFQGYSGLVKASIALVKLRKPTDVKLDYSYIKAEPPTLDRLIEIRTMCAHEVVGVTQGDVIGTSGSSLRRTGLSRFFVKLEPENTEKSSLGSLETCLTVASKVDECAIITKSSEVFLDNLDHGKERKRKLLSMEMLEYIESALDGNICGLSSSTDSLKLTLQGYGARHCATLRLLVIWLIMKWFEREMKDIKNMVACYAMTILKEEEAKEEESGTPKSSWIKWKRGRIIFTDASTGSTGGTLTAITCALAAPENDADFGALALTWDTIISMVGAGGLAAIATDASSVTGSVVKVALLLAAGIKLAGTKMTFKGASVNGFGFKAIWKNHKQGWLTVELLISRFIFEERDLIKLWKGQDSNLDMYTLEWESKNLITMSIVIPEWLTLRLAMELTIRFAKMMVLSSFLVALAWTSDLLSATDLNDSKWTIAIDIFDKVLVMTIMVSVPYKDADVQGVLDFYVATVRILGESSTSQVQNYWANYSLSHAKSDVKCCFRITKLPKGVG